MQREIDIGNRPFLISCSRDLRICDNNIESDPKRCSECIAVQRRAVRLFEKEAVTVIPLSKYIKRSSSDLPEELRLESLDDLKKLKYDNFDVGYSIGASLANYLDELTFDECKSKVYLFYSAGIAFYLATLDIIHDFDIDYGYVFNGRFCLSRAFFRAFEKRKLPVFTHDRGSAVHKFSINRNVLPHDIGAYTKRVEKFWAENADTDFKNEKAREYFTKRRFGKETDYISFTSKQVASKLPENFLFFDKRIVIFNSSTFEYDYIGPQYGYKYYTSQADGIRQICESLADDPNIGIFLREHPNLQGRINRQREEVRRFQFGNFFVVPAESDISSYDMLLGASAVVTFTSTMGIEATYWGKPSVLCSNAIYQELNIAYQPASHDDLIKLLKSDLSPIDKLDSIKYGYYHGCSGTDYRYYEPRTLFKGTFRGKDLYQSALSQFYKKAKRALKSIVKSFLTATNMRKRQPHPVTFK